jgi:arylsulfatase A-like enzyme
MVIGGVDLASMPARVHAALGYEQPNILVILTDDQRLAGTMVALPTVRRWFGDAGTTFSQAFDTTPLCCPSRATLMSGQFPHNSGVIGNTHDGRTLWEQDSTIQRYLQDAGYRTGFVGKLFNFWPVEEDPSYFDRWAIFHPSNRTSGYDRATWNIQGTLRTIDRYSTDFIAAQGVRFIRDAEAHDDRPWYLELSTYAPHLRGIMEPQHANAPVGPFVPTPAMRESDRSDKPPFVRREHVSRSKIEVLRAEQLRLLMSVDDLVERIAHTLRSTDEARNTLAVFVSDNAFSWGEHGIRAKGYPYRAGVQVPLLVRWPDHVEEGASDRRLVAMVDIAPTILDAAGLPQDAEAPMDGRSLLDDSWSRRRVLMEYWHWRGSSAPPWASLWGGDYQYTEYYDGHGEIVFREYYDLDADPWQLTNLLHDGRPGNDPDVTVLHDRLTEDRTCVGTACP